MREKNLVTLPDEPLEIIEMPEFQQRRGAGVLRFARAARTRRRRLFTRCRRSRRDWTRAQTDSFLREYNSRSIHNLTIHEAMPGHYLQLAHANQYPSTLRAVLASGPFIEGWAVYAERLMVEQGLHATAIR